MDWTSTLGIALITAGGVLAGSIVTSVLALVIGSQQNKSAARIAKDEREHRDKLDSERIEREDALSRAAAEEALRQEMKAHASEVVGAFEAELFEILALPEADEAMFSERYDKRWRVGKEIAFRRVTGRLLRVEDRQALMKILDALGTQDEVWQWNPSYSARSTIEKLLRTGLNAAMALERGEEQQDAELFKPVDEHFRRFAQWLQHFAEEDTRKWNEMVREINEDEARKAVQEEQQLDDMNREARDAACGPEERMHRYDGDSADTDPEVTPRP